MTDYRRISVRVEADLLEKLKALAKRRDLTRSQLVRHYIKNLIEQDEILRESENRTTA